MSKISIQSTKQSISGAKAWITRQLIIYTDITRSVPFFKLKNKLEYIWCESLNNQTTNYIYKHYSICPVFKLKNQLEISGATIVHPDIFRDISLPSDGTRGEIKTQTNKKPTLYHWVQARATTAKIYRFFRYTQNRCKFQALQIPHKTQFIHHTNSSSSTHIHRGPSCDCEVCSWGSYTESFPCMVVPLSVILHHRSPGTTGA